MIIWLASYPKSGNTWLRSIISSLINTDDGNFNFRLLDRIPLFPMRKHLQDFTKNFNNFEEVQKYWIFAQEKINLNNKINFFKTHQLNCNINNYEFTNKNNTAGAIYIVRDPRNLITSISNHYDKNIQESKKFLFTPRLIGTEPAENNVINLIGSWNEHYKFWTKSDLFKNKILLIKYEDLILDIEKQIEKIVAFLNRYISVPTNKNKIKKIIETTSFGNLQKMEENENFKEGVYDNTKSKKVKFFFRGPENNWKVSLAEEDIIEIETKFYLEMKELGYIK
jgi:hypothetical protein